MNDVTSELTVSPDATVGMSYDPESSPPEIGPDSVIRSGTVIYDDVVAGESLQTGHNALIRELTTLGANCLIGTNAVVDGRSDLGDGVSLQTGAYVPSETTLGDRVFLGPHATLLNDPYPVRKDADLTGPVVESDASIGANSTVLPGVTVGKGAFVAAGSIVTNDVPERTLAVGNPAEKRPLPDELDGGNNL
ncbi:acyltransferase [Halobellus captivus]|uniref:acyltransferase n=1 Tax=Halobellus captivus TaxID=2592614 RepID=UPI0011A769A7|nr:acyltransferase [Halobellus captivus]